MSIKIVFENCLEEQSFSEVYTEVLGELLRSDSDVVSLDADLMHAVGVHNIMDQYPGRVIDVGVAEANMMSITAGLSCAGKKPFVQTFGCFATRRAFDQLFISCAYGRNSIRIFGSDPGVCAAFNGGTHMPFEDVGLMRTIPGAVVMDLSDTTMLRSVMKQIKDMDGVIYFRATRAKSKRIYAEGSAFIVGKGVVTRDGSDVTIMTNGVLIPEALLAAEELERSGVSAAVLDLFTIKPLDVELVVEYAKKTGAVVTADNHNINGGLGDAVASALAENCPTQMKRMGVMDEFGEVGSLEYLLNRFSLNAQGFVEAVKALKKFI